MKRKIANLILVISLSVVAFLFVPPARAEQDRITVEPRLILGYANFLDEGPLHHFVAGGSARLYLTRRLGFEPELVYMYRSAADQDLVFLPNLTWDFRDPSKRVVPYVIGGYGVLRHTDLTGNGRFTSNSVMASAGFGAKFFLSRSLFVSPEFRLGWEPHYRITCSIGYSRRKK